MPYEIRIKERTSKVEILGKNGSVYNVKIDDRNYEVDVVKVENGVYSLIYLGRSINMEMIEGDTPNKYIVNTRSNDYQVEIIDAKARYRAAGKGHIENDDCTISSPMPGKIVKINVSKGDIVAKGETLIIVSAMKMESEYRSPIDGKVSHVFVKVDQTVSGNQPLIEIEPIEKN